MRKNTVELVNDNPDQSMLGSELKYGEYAVMIENPSGFMHGRPVFMACVGTKCVDDARLIFMDTGGFYARPEECVVRRLRDGEEIIISGKDGVA